LGTVLEIPKIIYEDQSIIVAVKPPNMPSQKDRSRDIDIGTYLKEKANYKKTPYIGLIHRLDRPVGGVMVFAKTPKANSNLSEQIRQGIINKKYLAVVQGKPDKNEATLTDYLVKLNNNFSKVTQETDNNSKKAVLDYYLLEHRELEEIGECSLLEIDLKTGRHHQIRVQLSNAGLPVWGDSKYNNFRADNKEWNQIALFSHTISFIHPVTKKTISFSDLPQSFPFNLFERIK